MAAQCMYVFATVLQWQMPDFRPFFNLICYGNSPNSQGLKATLGEGYTYDCHQGP